MRCSVSPRIYVTCLKSYTNGTLYGEWIDANQPAKDITIEIEKMLASSPSVGAEEFAFHDCEGFGEFVLEEYTSVEELAAMAEGIAKHGPAFRAWLATGYGSIKFEDAYMGEYDSVEEYGEMLLEDLGVFDAIKNSASESLVSFFDVGRYVNDLLLGGDIWTVPNGTGVFVFTSKLSNQANSQ